MNTTIQEKYNNPEVKVWDRIRVLLFRKGTHEYTDGATVIDENWELWAEFDDAEVHNNVTEKSSAWKQPIANLRYRLFEEWEERDQ